MTKYIRSTKKLTTLIKDIFAECEISIDSRVIVLLLACTMSSDKFNIWVDQITGLGALRVRYKAINVLRAELGTVCSKYIFLTVLNKVKHDLNSDELQQFISDSRSMEHVDILQPALVDTDIHNVNNFYPPIEKEGFSEALESARNFLIQKLNSNSMLPLSAVLDAYTNCRQHTSPSVAYYAIVHAIADILIHNGVASHEALLYSNKIAKNGLKELIHMTNTKKIFTCLYDKSVTGLTGGSLR